MVAKIIAIGIEGVTAASPSRYNGLDITSSAEQALVFAKGIAVRILNEIRICGPQKNLSGLSVNLNRTRAILQLEELSRERNFPGFHG